MPLLQPLLAGLLAVAAPVTVPTGTFQTWTASARTSADFRSDGVTVHVQALPCPAHPQGDTACHWDGYNNQALVTIRPSGASPDLPPLSVKTDPAASYARIAVVRFGRDDPRPGVIIESQSGGSGGDLTVQLVVPHGRGYRVLSLGRSEGVPLQGQLADAPRDLSGDGAIDLQWQDGAFAYVFGCNACTPRPPRLFTVRNGRVEDESRDPALRRVFAADMARLAPLCLSRARYRNGACAAYVADAARAGRFRSAWKAMLAHHERGGDLWQPSRFRSFPASLRAFLIHAGYLPG